MADAVEIEGESHYICQRFAHGDLEYAAKLLEASNVTSDPIARYCEFCMAVIVYCRPFKGSKIVENGKVIKKCFLDSNDVPDKFAQVHRDLEHARDKMFVHSDLDVRKPVLHAWTHTDPVSFLVGFKGWDFEELIRKSDEISQLIEWMTIHLVHQMSSAEQKFSAQIKLAQKVDNKEE